MASARCCHLSSRSIAFVVPAGSRACHAFGPSRSAALMIQASTRRERQGAGTVGTHSSHSWSSWAVSRAGRSRPGFGPVPASSRSTTSCTRPRSWAAPKASACPMRRDPSSSRRRYSRSRGRGVGPTAEAGGDGAVYHANFCWLWLTGSRESRRYWSTSRCRNTRATKGPASWRDQKVGGTASPCPRTAYSRVATIPAWRCSSRSGSARRSLSA